MNNIKYDKVAYISLCANAFRKGKNPFLPLPGFLSAGKTITQEKENSEFKQAVVHLNFTLCRILPVMEGWINADI